MRVVDVRGLFEPFAIRGLTVPNRIVMPAMTTRLAADDGTVTPEQIGYYAARARGGTGLVTVEMASPHPAGRHRAGELGLTDDRYLPGLERLTATIRGAGARASIQIGHAGGHTRQDVTGYPPVAPSAIPHVVQEVVTRTVVPEALTADGIRTVVAAFAETTARAARAGFDTVEIHGAHGYLLAQFLSPLENQRDDAYGGSLANRARLTLEVLEACRRRAGDLPLLFRLSADELVPGGFTPEEAVQVARWAVEAGADAIHVSAACYRSLPSGAMMTPPMAYPKGLYLHLAARVKRAVAVPVVAVGRLHDPGLAARAVMEGATDLVALGRQLIADPDWPLKVREGRQAEIRPCIACNTCIDGMREGSPLGCLVNPRIGGEPPVQAAAQPRRILVVGGGPAGMEAARRLAVRGHRVTLCEREVQLGGRLRLAARAPVFQNVEANEATMLELVDFLARELQRTGVDVQLGVTVTVDQVRALRPDVVVLAAGAPYRFPLEAVLPQLLAGGWARGRRAAAMARRPALKQLLISRLRRADARLEPSLATLGVPVVRIGDCRVPGRVPDAMRDAADAADRIAAGTA